MAHVYVIWKREGWEAKFPKDFVKHVDLGDGWEVWRVGFILFRKLLDFSAGGEDVAEGGRVVHPESTDIFRRRRDGELQNATDGVMFRFSRLYDTH